MSHPIPRLMTSLLILAMPQVLPPVAAAQTSAGRTAKTRKPKAPAMTTTASGLKYVDTKVGTGAMPQRGQRCLVHYTGWLSEKGQRGKKFDSSVDRGEPLAIPIGVGRVIKGWDEGLMTMKVGGKRTLHIPAALGYGARGAGADIPPNADLIFDVELLGIQ
nr:FKBP-type peptidyl-prolyl cis-trans isomerase [Geothrix fermentans]